MLDEQTHERLNQMEKTLDNHGQKIADFEASLMHHAIAIEENTKITKNIETNTAELVQLFKNVKSLRQMVLFYSPLVALFAVTWSGVNWLIKNIDKLIS